eukprot:9336914-Lingulodinium_polyedra.AAC.1
MSAQPIQGCAWPRDLLPIPLPSFPRGGGSFDNRVCAREFCPRRPQRVEARNDWVLSSLSW